MAEDLMRYDLLAQDALRGVVRQALRRAARDGLPGDHHFYVAFDTTFPGVRMSSRLKGKYPSEMTIVLQHQFWNLQVFEDRFEVDLTFDNIPERLCIPLNAIKGFLDPSVQFGLQFEVMEANENADGANDGNSLEGDHPPSANTDTPAEGDETGVVDEDKGSPDEQEEPAKVVQLDTFRKK